jgi:hypothetical protein
MQALGARVAIVPSSAKLNARPSARKVRAIVRTSVVSCHPRPSHHHEADAFFSIPSPSTSVLIVPASPSPRDPRSQSAVRATAVTAGIPIHIEYCEK